MEIVPACSGGACLAYKLFWRGGTGMGQGRLWYGSLYRGGPARLAAFTANRRDAAGTCFGCRRNGIYSAPKRRRKVSSAFLPCCLQVAVGAVAAAAAITWRPRRSCNGGGAVQGSMKGAAFEFRHGVARTAFAADLWNIASGGIGAVVAEAAWMARQIARRSRTVFAVPLRDAVGGIAVGIAETA